LRPSEVIVRTNLLRSCRSGGHNLRRDRVQVHQPEGGGLDEEGRGISGEAGFWQVLTLPGLLPASSLRGDFAHTVLGRLGRERLPPRTPGGLGLLRLAGRDGEERRVDDSTLRIIQGWLGGHTRVVADRPDDYP